MTIVGITGNSLSRMCRRHDEITKLGEPLTLSSHAPGTSIGGAHVAFTVEWNYGVGSGTNVYTSESSSDRRQGAAPRSNVELASITSDLSLNMSQFVTGWLDIRQCPPSHGG